MLCGMYATAHHNLQKGWSDLWSVDFSKTPNISSHLLTLGQKVSGYDKSKLVDREGSFQS